MRRLPVVLSLILLLMGTVASAGGIEAGTGTGTEMDVSVQADVAHGRYYQETDVTYRFLNLAPASAPGLDLYRNQNVAFQAVAPSQISSERVIGGEQLFQIYPQNADIGSMAPLAELTVTPASGSYFLLVAVEQGGQFALRAVTYNLAPLATGFSRIQVVHLSESASDLTFIGQNGDVLIERVAYDNPIIAEVPTGNYQLNLNNADNPAENIASISLEAAANQEMLVLLYGSAGISVFNLPMNVSGLSQFRFIHAGRTTAALDVYFNDTPVFSGIDYLGWTTYETLESGDYTVSLYPAGGLPGTDAPLWQGPVTLSGGFPVTGVALGESSFRMLTYADDTSQMPAERARVKFINATLNLPLLTVQQSTAEEPLVGGLEYVLGSRNQNIEIGVRTLTFKETGFDTYATLENFEFAFNTFYTFVISGDALIPESVEVIVVPWNWHDR